MGLRVVLRRDLPATGRERRPGFMYLSEGLASASITPADAPT
jgi:hypothetical protein